jgi:hypothetical protein
MDPHASPAQLEEGGVFERARDVAMRRESRQRLFYAVAGTRVKKRRHLRRLSSTW